MVAKGKSNAWHLQQGKKERGGRPPNLALSLLPYNLLASAPRERAKKKYKWENTIFLKINFSTVAFFSLFFFLALFFIALKGETSPPR